MKGPGHRNRFDVRRVWECPVCQRRVKTSGRIVTLRCEACGRNKTGDTAWMRLIEPPRPGRKAPPAKEEIQPVPDNQAAPKEE